MCLKQGGGDEAHGIESCRKSRQTEFAPPGAGRNPTFNKVFFNFQLLTFNRLFKVELSSFNRIC
jgi:hypothetical protein